MYFKLVPIKSLFLLLLVLFICSCEKEYSCVCKYVSTGNDTIIEKVKTTELGYKGYKDYCSNKSKDSIINCQVK